MIKCELKPPNRAEYNVPFTDGQWARLLEIFPKVCDWNERGVGQVLSRPWTSFASGPGGHALGPAPVAQPF